MIAEIEEYFFYTGVEHGVNGEQEVASHLDSENYEAYMLGLALGSELSVDDYYGLEV